jgi:GxxExxY protein
LINGFYFDYLENITRTIMKFSDITEKIIGCAMKVHRELGAGFQEYIYQRALEIDLVKAGMNFIREYEMPVYYCGEKIGIRKVDFFVENRIMVEIKAVAELDDTHLAQALNYLEASGHEVGLLINFGAKSLQFKRLHNRKPIS